MRILIIRHADPDYERDSLTEKGWREAKLLGDRLAKEEIRDFYVSTMGRAQDTASFTLKAHGKEAEVCEWLQEFFRVRIRRPDRPDKESISWDWLPKDFSECPELLDREKWRTNPLMKEGGVPEEYDRVCGEFDRLLLKYGYRRENGIYRTEQGNTDTIALFCHFGSGAVLISHLLNVSPLVVMQNFCGLPSSVTTFYTEERRKSYVSFRMSAYGDLSHLYAGGEEPSFAARFREIYENDFQRID